MEMEIREITNKEVWESFLLGCSEKTFLNSWNWGEFQKKIEEKIWRFGIYENQELIGIALVIKIKAKRGTFLFVPHGPNIKLKVKSQKLKILETLMNELRKIAKQEKASFIRIGPIWEKSEENIRIFKELSFRDAPIHIHPEITWELNIGFSEGELLKGMRKTTRYLIRQAEKNQEIEIIKSRDVNDLEKFSQLLNKTALRHHFTAFSLNYLKNQFFCFYPDNEIMIFLGKYKEEIISSAIMIYWQKIGFYHHGASLSQNNKIPVSYLLQWEAIKEAKKRGCVKYNFWGVAEKNWKLKIGNWKFFKHPWAGLSLFKMGFGGHKKEYLKTQDLALSGKYYLTYFFEKARKIKRGL